MSTKSTLRSIFVSDLHLGYKGADIRSLNAFLRAHTCRHLYLVGDILDGWKLEKRWYWNQDYSDFLDTLIEFKNKGGKITVLSGNHDEKLREHSVQRARRILSRRFGLTLKEQAIHQTKDGRRLLVIHGDQFDSPLLRSASRHADDVWSRVDDLAWARSDPGDAGSEAKRRRWSLGKAIATHAKALIWSYTDAATDYAVARGLDGIICGHSHVAALVTRGTTVFGNCGSWTGARDAGSSHTALAEHTDGRLELLKWPSMRGSHEDTLYKNLGLDDIRTKSVEAATLARLIRGLWTPTAMDETAPETVIWPPRLGHTTANL